MSRRAKKIIMQFDLITSTTELKSNLAVYIVVLMPKYPERPVVWDQIKTSLRTMAPPPTPPAPSHLTSGFMPRSNPSKHLTYQDPSNILSMKHVGFAKDGSVSPVVVTLPFPLFPSEAIRVLCSEMPSQKCGRATDSQATLLTRSEVGTLVSSLRSLTRHGTLL
jgi:hypothetical protein